MNNIKDLTHKELEELNRIVKEYLEYLEKEEEKTQN